MAENMLLIWRKLTKDQKDFLFNNLTTNKKFERESLLFEEMPWISLEEMLAAHDDFFRPKFSPLQLTYDSLRQRNPEALNIRRKLEE